MIQNSRNLEVDFIHFVSVNLKDDKISQSLPFNNLTIHNIDLQKISIQDFTTTFFAFFGNLYMERAKLGSLQNFNKSMGVESLDQLRPESKLFFEKLIHTNAQKTCFIALEKFNKNEPFGSVIASTYIEKDAPAFSPHNFTGLKCGFQPISDAQNERNLKIGNNRKRLADKKQANDRQKFISTVNQSGEEWKSIMQVSAFYFSKEFQGLKDLNERSEDHLIENYASIVEKYKNYELKKKTKACEAAYKALCLDQEYKENSTTTKNSVKTVPLTEGTGKTRKTASRPTTPPAKKPTVDVKAVERHRLNSALNTKAPSVYVLHSRIRRWDINDANLIKGFIDTEEGNLVKKYQNMSQNELLQQQAYHNLGGILPVLADQKLLDKYSFKYNTRSNTSDNVIGRCFYAEMQHKGNTHFGRIELGIGQNNLIFHAKFAPIDLERRPEIKDLFVSTKNVEGLNQKEESQWNQVSACTFEVLENDMLVMNVKRQAVKFIIHPLN